MLEDPVTEHSGLQGHRHLPDRQVAAAKMRSKEKLLLKASIALLLPLTPPWAVALVMVRVSLVCQMSALVSCQRLPSCVAHKLLYLLLN